MTTAAQAITPLSQKIGAVAANQIQSVEFLNMLVFGDPGVGKTTLLGTAQDHELTRPYLHIDVEGGTKVFQHRDDIDVVEVRSMRKLVELQNALYRENELSYRTIGIDNLSELQSLDISVIMEEAYNTARDPSKVDKDVPSQREWGKTRNHMRAIVRSFRDLPCHTILTCHVDELIKEGEPSRMAPALSGRARREIPGFMDVVGYLYLPGTSQDRRLQFAQSRRVAAKTRIAALGDFVDHPTIPLLWEKILTAQEGG